MQKFTTSESEAFQKKLFSDIGGSPQNYASWNNSLGGKGSGLAERNKEEFRIDFKKEIEEQIETCESINLKELRQTIQEQVKSRRTGRKRHLQEPSAYATSISKPVKETSNIGATYSSDGDALPGGCGFCRLTQYWKGSRIVSIFASAA